MNKAEILQLHKMSSSSQRYWLLQNGIIFQSESLPDCAFRLQLEWFNHPKRIGCWKEILGQLPIWGTETCEICEATPINWIQAALLEIAKLKAR